ncbi:acyltransferase family protein [Frigidibacter oleivorans]|uniref:acyltransferase family protein n=1 Tax=Frigidibacter oleivorans TaxID=2487129 RepID=UPI0013DF95C8|nr:acyltransferase family protein [Frigidibacter oleivorans]
MAGLIRNGQAGRPAWQAGAARAGDWRADIDGLRGLSVAGVLVYHLGAGWLPGGFSGVDVFFVISGFLVTAILRREMAAGQFSLMRFYRRRALRILPSLLLVVAATLVLSVAVLLPGEVRATARAAAAALMSGSNLLFWVEVDYFAPVAKDNPLLHTWSLGVEEQFYLLLPALVWLMLRLPPGRRVWPLAASVALSFLLAAVLVGRAPAAAFYLLPSRWWELGAGSLLAMVAWRPRAGHDALSLAGIGLILGSFLLLRPGHPFPGPGALPAVLGAVALIAAGPESMGGRLLSRALPVGMGRISYALYLWHWPLIVLCRLRLGPDLPPGALPGVAALSVVLAALTTRLVEEPLRALPPGFGDRRLLAGAAAVLGLGVALSVAIAQRPERLRHWPAEVARLESLTGWAFTEEGRARDRRDRCFVTSTTPAGAAAFDADFCLGDGGGRPRVLMLGDSYAAHLVPALAAARPDLAVLQANASACRPVLEPVGPAYCVALMRRVLQDWLPAAPPEAVVISANWRAGDGAALAATVAHLRAAGVAQVLVLGVTPEWRAPLPKLLARDLMRGSRTAAGATNPDRRAVGEEIAAAARAAGAGYLDLLALICPGGPCRTHAGGAPFAFDHAHYLPGGAAVVAAEIAPRLLAKAGAASRLALGSPSAMPSAIPPEP